MADSMTTDLLVSRVCGAIKDFYTFAKSEDVEASAHRVSAYMKELAGTNCYNTDDFTKGINSFSKAVSQK